MEFHCVVSKFGYLLWVFIMDRAVDLEEVKILRKRLSDCVRREEVNHLQRCRPQSMAYWKAFRKYRSEGTLHLHYLLVGLVKATCVCASFY